MHRPTATGNDTAASPAMNLRGWMLLLGMLTYGSFYTGRQNFGIAAVALRSDLHLTAFQVGTISGAMLIVYAAGSFLSGYLADRFDVRLLVGCGALSSLCLNWAMSYATGYRRALLFWACNGAAQALAWSPCSRMVTSWWPDSRRASTFGVILFAAGLASVFTYAISLLCLEKFGWRFVFRLPVLFVLPTALLFVLFARHAGSKARQPVPLQATRPAVWWHHYAPLLKDGRFLLLCGSIGCESLARYGLLIWVPIHILGRDWKTSGPGRWLMLFLPLGMALGALSTGFLSDRVFRANRVVAIVVQMFAGALLAAGLYFVPHSAYPLSCFLLLLAGFAVYGPQAAYWTVGCETGGPERHGVALGTMDAAAYLFAACGEGGIGWIVDRTGTTRAIFPTIACACTIAALAALPSLRRRGVNV